MTHKLHTDSAPWAMQTTWCTLFLTLPSFTFFSGSQRRRLLPGLSPEVAPPARKPATSSSLRWVDLRPVQRGMAEPFEIKVYEIDDVERLQRRRAADSKVCRLHHLSSLSLHQAKYKPLCTTWKLHSNRTWKIAQNGGGNETELLMYSH